MKRSAIAGVSGAWLAVALCMISGCRGVGPASTTGASTTSEISTSAAVNHGVVAPGPMVDIEWDGRKVKCWPYTGTDFSGRTQDPINLVFIGEVDAVQVRAALLSLDGDRTGYIPPELQAIPLFSETWSDALGNVQTGYVEGEGWIGAVVQLQLGSYAPLRFHVRLFESHEPFGAAGRWTLGSAHLDMLIGVTADHQVISWELAEFIVAVDMVRSGLLHPSSLPMPSTTGVINEEPSYHEVPLAIYAGMPQWLRDIAGLVTPAIPNDGEATILHVVGTTPVVEETTTSSFSMPYAQLVPKPFCSAGPTDVVALDGVVDLRKTVRVDAKGVYQYTSTISGHLTVTPMDVTQSPPIASGASYRAIVRDEQRGMLAPGHSRVSFDTKRIAPRGTGGVDKQMVELKVSSNGTNIHKETTQCALDGP